MVCSTARMSAPGACRPSWGCGCSSTASSRWATFRGAERRGDRALARWRRARHRRDPRAAPATCCRASRTARVWCSLRRPRRRSGTSSWSRLAPDRALSRCSSPRTVPVEEARSTPRRMGPDALRDMQAAANLVNANPAGPHPRRANSTVITPKSPSAAPSSMRCGASPIEDGDRQQVGRTLSAGRDRLIVRGRAEPARRRRGRGAQLDAVRSLFDDPRAQAQPSRRSWTSPRAATGCGCSSARRTSFSHFLFSLVVGSLYECGPGNRPSEVGVIGPTRLNYGRIVPIVDYAAQLVGRMVCGPQQGLARRDVAKERKHRRSRRRVPRRHRGGSSTRTRKSVEEEIGAEVAEADEASGSAEVADLKDRLLSALAQPTRKRADGTAATPRSTARPGRPRSAAGSRQFRPALDTRPTPSRRRARADQGIEPPSASC